MAPTRSDFYIPFLENGEYEINTTFRIKAWRRVIQKWGKVSCTVNSIIAT